MSHAANLWEMTVEPPIYAIGILSVHYAPFGCHLTIARRCFSHRFTAIN